MFAKPFGRALAAPAAMSLLMLPLLPGAASAQDAFTGVDGSGTATVTLPAEGGQAEISVEWNGLAPQIPDLSGTDYAALSNMPFPHAQHIHAGGEGRCPDSAADSDGNGVIDTPEGLPAYGPVVVSLTSEPAETGPGQTLAVENFPTGASADYTRTIDISGAVQTDVGTVNPAEQVRSGDAVIVVHGLNPAIMPGDTALQASKLNPDFPLAATAPALCGVLQQTADGTFTAQLSPVNVVAQQGGQQADQQVAQQPAGGVAAGGGSTAAAVEPVWPAAVAAALVAGAAATGVAVTRRRPTS